MQSSLFEQPEDKINSGSEIPELSVSEFNNLINTQLGSLGEFVIEGEITQMNISSRGGVNMVLKDEHEKAILNVSGYSPRISGINMVDEGMKVKIWGTPQIWSPSGRFSVSIRKIQPFGEGALRQAYEKLKQMLRAEGLFEEDRKRDLPEFVTKIALITADGSAAQSDFLKILRENKSGVEIDFYRVQVQGKYAETQIIKTFDTLAQTENDYDCIVLTRGGGSLEDLIAFNDEILARKIFAIKTPVIVGVGHERDESIADFVADVRASTPSQAAYYLVAQNQAFIQEQEMKAEKMYQTLLKQIHSTSYEVDSKIQRLDKSFQLTIQKIKSSINNLYISASKLPQKLDLYNNQLTTMQLVLENFPRRIETKLDKIRQTERILQSFNPERILNKGYSITYKENKIVSSTKQIKTKDKLSIQLKDGKIDTEVVE